MSRLMYFNCRIEPYYTQGYNELRIQVRTNNKEYGWAHPIRTDDIHSLLDRVWKEAKYVLDQAIKKEEPLSLQEIEKLLKDSDIGA